MFIGVAGLIGAGKSTFTGQLAAHLDKSERLKVKKAFAGDTPFEEQLRTEDAVVPNLWSACYEPVETNPFLEDFYKDIPRWTWRCHA